MTQYSAVIRRKDGNPYTTLVETTGEGRAKEIAQEIAEAEDGELVSVTEVPAAPPESEPEPSDG